MPAAASLATIGTAVSVGVVGVAAHMLLDVGWQDALLIGAVLAPTDSAAVFSVLRKVPLPPRLGGLLEAESGFNDAPVVILVVALASTDHSVPSWWELLAAHRVRAGARRGRGHRRRVRRGVGRPPDRAAVVGALPARRAGAVRHGLRRGGGRARAAGSSRSTSPALVLGNARLPHRSASRGFVEGAGWLAQIGLFVMLGLLATPAELGPLDPAGARHRTGPAAGGAAAVGVPLVAAVPVAGPSLALPDDPRERVLLSWAGLRGAVPIVLATVSGDPDVFNLVFVLVIVFTLVQAPTLPRVARALDVVAEGEAQSLDIESSPLTRLDADLLQVHVADGSRLAGVEVFELQPADRRGRQPDRPRRLGLRTPAQHPAPGRRRPDPGGHRVGAPRGRTPAAGGLPPRPAGRLGDPAPPAPPPLKPVEAPS